MSRFKFRIWDKKNGRWFHGDPSDEARELGVDSIDLLGEVITVGDILRDKNDGKMINLERLNDLLYYNILLTSMVYKHYNYS